MVVFLRILFAVILASMLAVTSWASRHCPIFSIPPDVLHHPWFIATMCDAYWAFITFFVWVCWKEQSAGARILWLIGILLWGNIAMSIYMLSELCRIKTRAQIGEVFSQRRPGRLLLPTLLTALGIAVYLLGAKDHF